VSAERAHGFYDEANETLTRAQIRTFQESFLPSLVRFCFDNSSHYREKMQGARVDPGDVVTLDDLAKVPVTRKHETQDLKFEGLMTVPFNEARRIFVSPGPQFYAYGPIPQKMNPLLKVYHAVGLRPRDIVVNTFTYHYTPAGVNFDESLGEFGCAVVPAGPGQTELLVDVLRKLPVTGYVGTPSFLKIIAARARELGFDPRADFSLECALTSAEALPESLRAELEETYGITVRQLYGSADGLLPCFECGAADGMHVPEMMILEIVDEQTGEALPPGTPGAVCASVFNPYRPLLRFCNGDRGIIVDEPCVCGRTAARFRFAGRIDEAAKVRGMFVYPEQIAEALARAGIGRWRARVEHDASGLDSFVVEYEGEAEPGAVAEAVRAGVRVRAECARLAPGTIAADGKRLEDLRPHV
jgi:phenylacetate-CoA ligase